MQHLFGSSSVRTTTRVTACGGPTGRRCDARLASGLVLFGWLTVACAGPAVRTAHALPGEVGAEQRISSTSGGFGGVLNDQDQFGSSVTRIGDLNGDAVGDLAAGAARDGDGGAGAGAVWVLFAATDASVIGQTKISATTGGLVSTLEIGDQFGNAVAGIGDLDGDEVPDLVVGADGDDDGGVDRGAVYVLFMNSNGTVKAEQKISSTDGGLGSGLVDGDRFGTAVASLGDLDGDGVVDLAVGAPLSDGGGMARGAVWILFLNPDGTVRSSSRIDDTTGGLGGNLADFDLFGVSVGVFRDLDGDQVVDLVVGASGDSQSGTGRGAVWILNLTTAGAVGSVQKINDTSGGLTATLDNADAFGASVAAVPDLNGDGVEELAVGATGDDTGGVDRGQVYILFMNASSTVKSFRRVNAAGSGFVGPLVNNEMFGNALASIRDLNEDGVPDLAVGLRFADDGGVGRGAAYVLLLDGTPGGLCGDGVLDPGEVCDDGNRNPDDCCDDSCTYATPGASCSDGDVCNGEETCNGAGECLPGTSLECSDGQPCTQDRCDPVQGCMSESGPALDCRASLRSTVLLTDKSPQTDRSKLSWKWLQGGETTFEDLGNPIIEDTYALCIYDEIAGLPSLVSEIVIPPSQVRWSVSGGQRGYRYRDVDGVEGGVKTLQIKTGAEGKAKITLKAGGAALPLPGPVGGAYFDQDPAVFFQLINADSGQCWSAQMTSPPLKTDSRTFRDKY